MVILWNIHWEWWLTLKKTVPKPFRQTCLDDRRWPLFMMPNSSDKFECHFQLGDTAYRLLEQCSWSRTRASEQSDQSGLHHLLATDPSHSRHSCRNRRSRHSHPSRSRHQSCRSRRSCHNHLTDEKWLEVWKASWSDEFNQISYLRRGGMKASPQSNAHVFFCLCAEVSRSKGGC